MRHLPLDPFFRRLFITIVLGLFLYVLFQIRSVITPFVVAFILAYMLNPLVSLLSRRIPRVLAIVTVYITAFFVVSGLLIWLVPLLWGQIVLAWTSLPVLIDWYNDTARAWILENFGSVPEALDLDLLSSTVVQYMQENYQVADVRTFVRQALTSGASVANNIGLIVMVPILTFYFLLSWQERLQMWLTVIPKPHQAKVRRIAHDCDAALMSFFKGQLLVMILLGIIYAVQLQLIGLNLGLIIGISAGIASFVPYLGFGVGIVAALIAGIFQFGFDPVYLGLIIGAFLVGQIMEGYVLQPLLLGDKIGLSALWVIFSVLAGASLFGFVGMLIALPVSAIINVLFRHAYLAYLDSDWYQGYKQLKLFD